MTDHSKPVRIPMPAWTDEELRTLVEFRRRKGRRWKSKLLDLYLFGKDDSEPDGAALRLIRNRQGPSRVHALPKAMLDEAEARFPTQPEPRPSGDAPSPAYHRSTRLAGTATTRRPDRSRITAS